MSDFQTRLREELTATEARANAMRGLLAHYEVVDAQRVPDTFTGRRSKPAKGHATDERVFRAVKAGAETIGYLAGNLNLPVYNVRMALKRLMTAGKVKATGNRRSRRFMAA